MCRLDAVVVAVVAVVAALVVVLVVVLVVQGWDGMGWMGVSSIFIFRPILRRIAVLCAEVSVRLGSSTFESLGFLLLLRLS